MRVLIERVLVTRTGFLSIGPGVFADWKIFLAACLKYGICGTGLVIKVEVSKSTFLVADLIRASRGIFFVLLGQLLRSTGLISGFYIFFQKIIAGVFVQQRLFA